MGNQEPQTDRSDTSDRGGSSMRHHHLARRITGFIIAVLAVLAAVVLFVAYFPTGKKETPPARFTPIRDDALAARYQPIFDCPTQFGPILALYYRAAKDEAGIIHIAYHPLWAKEENRAPGFGAFLSRYLYTGGLSLQHLMFGPGDIEVIGLAINSATGAIVQIDYETAANYDASKFSVTHEAVSQKGDFALPLRFAVVSWNHLFSLEGQGGTGGATTPAAPSVSTVSAQAEQVGQGSATGTQPTQGGAGATQGSSSQPLLSYFTPALWNRYGIWKNPQTILRKNRAHFAWERASAE